MSVAIFTHTDCLLHDPGQGHPEHAGRLQRVLEQLDKPPFAKLTRPEVLPLPWDLAALAHSPRLIEQIQQAEQTLQDNTQNSVAIDADTVIGTHSVRAARMAAGAVVGAIDYVCKQEGRRAFCAVRPPGHHAEADTAMGFCLLNGAAIGALYALEKDHAKRVAVLDFDVHHGNGTEDILRHEPRALYASCHQQPLYPGTGTSSNPDLGIFDLPLPPQTEPDLWRKQVDQHLLQRIAEFAPDLLIISAGFDGHFLDPLADWKLRAEDYRWITERVLDIAATHCNGRVVSVLEGGYSLAGLAEGVAAHVSALMTEV